MSEKGLNDLYDCLMAGADAYRAGKPMKTCPHGGGTPEATLWCRGWINARDQYNEIAKQMTRLHRIRNIIQNSQMANSIAEGYATLDETMELIEGVLDE